MLMRLTNIKGQDIWINPIHVKAVYAKRKHTEVVVPLNPTVGHSVVKVTGTVQEVVQALNLGMPEILPPLPPEDESGLGGGAGAAALMG